LGAGTPNFAGRSSAAMRCHQASRSSTMSCIMQFSAHSATQRFCRMKDVAPTPKLRTWFSHEPERFVEFRKHYRQELAANPVLPALRKLGKRRIVTLLYAAHDPKINHATVLLSALKGQSLSQQK